jgi:hypothetical protein
MADTGSVARIFFSVELLEAKRRSLWVRDCGPHEVGTTGQHVVLGCNIGGISAAGWHITIDGSVMEHPAAFTFCARFA